MSVRGKDMLKTATRWQNIFKNHKSLDFWHSLLVWFNCKTLFILLQVPSEEEYYQQEEFTHKRKATSTATKSKPMPPEHSLFIFSPTNPLRQKFFLYFFLIFFIFF